MVKVIVEEFEKNVKIKFANSRSLFNKDKGRRRATFSFMTILSLEYPRKFSYFFRTFRSLYGG